MNDFLEWEGIEDDFDEDFCSIVLMKNYVTKNAKKHVFYTIFTSISPRFSRKDFFKGKLKENESKNGIFSVLVKSG